MGTAPISNGSVPAENPRAISVAVASNDSLRRRRLIAILEGDGISVRAQAESPDELREIGGELREAVVVIACDISEPATVAGMRRVRSEVPEARIVIVSGSSHGTGVRRALNSGADGFVLESRMDETLACTVRAVHSNQVCAPRELRRWVAKPSFTHREKQILSLVAAGATNKEIANELFLAESTVKSHLASLFGKLGVRSRKDALAIVLDPQEGLLATALPADADPLLSVPPANGANGSHANGAGDQNGAAA
jgi:DNA-binding NarL/FixJ family response regulator